MAELIEAQAWIKEIEKAFSIVGVEEDQKTAFATYLFKGEANFWWEANQFRAGEGVVAWARLRSYSLRIISQRVRKTRWR